jgi:hypothetical protein
VPDPESFQLGQMLRQDADPLGCGLTDAVLPRVDPAPDLGEASV